MRVSRALSRLSACLMTTQVTPPSIARKAPSILGIIPLLMVPSADGTINKGMIPKIEGAFRAIDGGVTCVVIKHADNLDNALETRIVE